ncbi:MAG: ATP-binding protein [Kangiellaceae bacterium]|nr:ATP-binding protein [Kangiellaceae bacterium]
MCAIQPKLRFDSLTQEDGLSNTSVFKIYQDKQGFIWLGTDDGLNRFDGYEFIIYRHSSSNHDSISSNRVFDIIEDKQGALWIATSKGLNKFDPKTQRFKRFNHDPESKNSLADDMISDLEIDFDGKIWIATRRTGISLFDPTKETFIRFRHSANDETSISSDVVSQIYKDSENNIWICSYRGFNFYDRETKSFQRYTKSPGAAGLIANDISRVIEDKEGNLWLVAGIRGLTRFNPKQKTFKYFPIPNSIQTSKNKNFEHPWRLIYDELNRIWIGTFGGGLIRFDIEKELYQLNLLNPYDHPDNASSYILSMFQDSSNTIWMGAENIGVNYFNLESESFNYFDFSLSGAKSAEAGLIQSIFQVDDKQMWLGTNANGLYKIDLLNKKKTIFNSQYASQFEVLERPILDIAQSIKGDLWLAVHGVGAVKFSPQTEELWVYKTEENEIHALTENDVMDIEVDSQDNIWILTYTGIRKIDSEFNLLAVFSNQSWDPQGNIFATQFLFDNDDRLIVLTTSGLFRLSDDGKYFEEYPKGLEQKKIFNDRELLSIHQDAGDTIWIGSRSGFFRLNVGKRIFSHVDISEWSDINSEFVFNLVSDDEKNIWFLTNSELVKYMPSNKQYVRYGSKEGLRDIGSNTHNRQLVGDLAKNHRGELLVTGNKGLYTFNPSLKINPPKATQVALTSLFVIGKKVKVSGEAANEHSEEYSLSQDIRHTDKIQFGYKESVFSLEFSALEYLSPSSTNYAFKLEGFDSEWRHSSGTNRKVSYTNLSPGDYVFKVKSMSKHLGAEENIRELKIEILPPPWRSWWAYGIYLMVGLIMVYYIYHYQKSRLQLANQVAMNKELLKFDKLKDTFLANTTHELRTPLQGIIGITELLIEESIEGEVKEKLKLVSTSGKRLNSLINDILDYSKLKNGLLEINRKSLNLSAIVESVLKILAVMVESKPVKLINYVGVESPAVIGDENRLQQIFLNLISNAIKHTKEGAILVKNSLSSTHMKIIVEDSGSGIIEEDHESIFLPFSQSKKDKNEEVSGTGIGLAVTRQLVELHGGRIYLDKSFTEGARFVFMLPLDKSAMLLKDGSADGKSLIGSQTNIDNKKQEEEASGFAQYANIVTHAGEKRPKSKYKILTVDDNPINLKVLNGILGNQYCVIQACDGYQALQLLEENRGVDMVILDLVMPELSGFQVCKRIRESYSFDELPILFLTGSSLQEDIEKGYEAGGNEFIEKPVSSNALRKLVSKYLD